MNTYQYQLQAARTKSDKFYNDIHPDIIHAAIGIATEAGEFLDPIKKSMFYSKPVDLVNMDEEIGDIMWYIAIYCNARGIQLSDVLATNINKLRKRYPEKFTNEHAINRDLEEERAVLEEDYDKAKQRADTQ